MLARARRRRHVGDHHRPRVPHERVAKHLGELRAAERDVAGAAIERADALLQRQEALVDLCALYAGLAVVLRRVRASLGPREVDEGKFAVNAFVVRARRVSKPLRNHRRGNSSLLLRVVVRAVARSLEHELHDGVRSAALGVGAGRAHAPRRRAVRDELLHQAHVVDFKLLQADDAHLRARVLANHQLLAPVEQVVHFASVNLEKRNVQSQVYVGARREISLARVPRRESSASFQFSENLARGANGQRVHGVRLPRPGLPVRETGDFALVKHRADQRRDGRAVHLVVVHLLRKHVVEVKRVLLRVARQVHLRLGFPHRHRGGRLFVGVRRSAFSSVHRHDVLLVPREFLGVERTLAHHDADARLVRGERGERRRRRIRVFVVRVDGTTGDEGGLGRIANERRLVFFRDVLFRRTPAQRDARDVFVRDDVLHPRLAAQPPQMLQRLFRNVFFLRVLLSPRIVLRGGRRERVVPRGPVFWVLTRQRAQQELVVLCGVDVQERRAQRSFLEHDPLRVEVLDEPEQCLLVRDVHHPELLEVHHPERRELALGRAGEVLAVLAQTGAAQPLAHAAVRGRRVAVVAREHGGDGHRARRKSRGPGWEDVDVDLARKPKRRAIRRTGGRADRGGSRRDALEAFPSRRRGVRVARMTRTSDRSRRAGSGRRRRCVPPVARARRAKTL